MSRIHRSFLWRLLLVAALISPAVASGQERAPDARWADAAMYARDYPVDLKEALRRLRLQEFVGELDRRLAETEPGTFAGLWLEHHPKFRVVVRSTVPEAGERILAHAQGGPLASMIEVRSARFTLAELAAAQTAAIHLARRTVLAFDAGIDLRRNRVELYTVEQGRLQSSLESLGTALPEAVVIEAVSELAEETVDIYGGLNIFCTSGFSVKNSSGVKGITTAGHCPNNLSFAGTFLPMQQERYAGSSDVQWHTAPGLNVTNLVNTGSGTRAITGIKTRSSQSVGFYVCKYGITTDYGCGRIEDKNYQPSYVPFATSNFIRVGGNGTDLSEPGDSGGPWFSGNYAYGIMSGQNGDDAIYMPVDYISLLNGGVAVLTSGAPMTASLYCWGDYVGSSQVSCRADTVGGQSPFTYSWTYGGTASSWNPSGRYAYAYYPGASCGPGDISYFSVRVTDAAGQSVLVYSGDLFCGGPE